MLQALDTLVSDQFYHLQKVEGNQTISSQILARTSNCNLVATAVSLVWLPIFCQSISQTLKPSPDCLRLFASLVDVVMPLFILYIVSVHLLMEYIRSHLEFKLCISHHLFIMMLSYSVHSFHLYWLSVSLSPFSTFSRISDICKKTSNLLECFAVLIISCISGVCMKCLKYCVVIDCCHPLLLHQINHYCFLSWSILAESSCVRVGLWSFGPFWVHFLCFHFVHFTRSQKCEEQYVHIQSLDQFYVPVLLFYTFYHTFRICKIGSLFPSTSLPSPLLCWFP